jgi:hypothetical protein
MGQRTCKTPFQDFLRFIQVLQHATFLTLGDASYKEAKAYFEGKLEDMPADLKDKLDFEEIYQMVRLCSQIGALVEKSDAQFGGKLAHISNYIEEYGKPFILALKKSQLA